MPELPELETLVNDIRPQALARRVIRTWLRHQAFYRRGSLRLPVLRGGRIAAVQRIGKNALFRFEPETLLVVNLGMTGRLSVAPTDNDGSHARTPTSGASVSGAPKNVGTPASRPPGSWSPDPGGERRHLHMRITFDDGTTLCYHDPRRFGHLYVARTCDFLRDLNIGPDPFVASPADLERRLRGRTAPVKALLLDQRILSGIGNIYADEILFYAGIDPRRAGGRVAPLAGRLIAVARHVLQRAIEHGGSTIRDYRRNDGSPGGFQALHAVYGRTAMPCSKCGKAITKAVVAGRGTHFCPSCQR